MRAVRWSPVVAAIATATIAVATPEPSDPRRLFPLEAEVRVERAGPARLVLPGEVLAACRPDLSDLRLFDPAGREIPFRVDGGARGPAVVEVIQRFDARPREVARAETRREDGPPLRRETIEIDTPAETPRNGSWDLVLSIARPEFVARVDVESTGADPVRLVDGASLFRLARAGAEKTRLRLPPFAGDGLRVTLETEQPFWLEPSLALESSSRTDVAPTIDVPLEVVGRTAEPGRTVFDLARPRGVVPDALRVGTATRAFDRPVEVRDAGPGSTGAALGAGRVFRVAAHATVEELDVPLDEAHGDRLRVVVIDGDSPPLEEPSFTAVVRQPALLFYAESSGTAATLAFGGGRARPPRYDLADLLPASTGSVEGSRARAASLLLDRTAVAEAALEPIRPNPAHDRTPALAFAMRPAARVDRGDFRYARELSVPDAAEGLSRVRLEPEDLAVLRPDLADLRVADGEGRQWPYLLEHEARTAFVPLTVSRSRVADRRSRFALRPPTSPLAFDRLELDVAAPFLDREFELRVETEDRPAETVASGRLVRLAGETEPVAIDLRPVRAGELELLIRDGDDAPLDIAAVRGRVRLPDMYLTAPAGGYALLLGSADAASPRYELARVRDVVLAVRAADAAAGPLRENHGAGLRARIGGRGALSRIGLWAVLVAAVLVLAGITVRLARR